MERKFNVKNSTVEVLKNNNVIFEVLEVNKRKPFDWEVQEGNKKSWEFEKALGWSVVSVDMSGNQFNKVLKKLGVVK